MGDVWWRRYFGWVIVAAVVAIIGIAQLVNTITGSDRSIEDNPTAAPQEPSATTSRVTSTYATSWPTSPTDPPPPPEASSYDAMPGDGTYQMGGMDGKNWGVWTAVAVGECKWSVRAVAPGAPGQVLDEGTAPRGERVQVAINPTGDVSLSGMVDDSYRVVFMTNGCGAWSVA